MYKRQAEAGTDQSSWDRIVTAFRNLLRKLGFCLEIGTRELRGKVQHNGDNHAEEDGKHCYHVQRKSALLESGEESLSLIHIYPKKATLMGKIYEYKVNYIRKL